MAGVASVEELDTRSMQVQTRHSSQYITVSSCEQIMILRGPRASRRQFSARARIAKRGLERVGFDAASMLDDRLFNGDPRRESQSRLQVCLMATKCAPRTEMGVKTLLHQCPSHSPTRWLHATRPTWVDGGAPCASTHLGASAGGAAQREREGHWMNRRRATKGRRKKFLQDPLLIQNGQKALFQLPA